MSTLPGGLIGVEVGERYRVLREIGRGGMGVVYEAHDQVLDRSVALKFLEISGDDEQFQERFRHEAAVLARMQSRHIVAIYDYDSHEGTPYLVTQLVPDGDLHTHLRVNGPMPPAQALAMSLQVCEALSDAHAEGVLHRDIKPANVLLRRQHDDEFRVFLCDFGIAESGDTQLTKTGAVVGSTSYMAPERLHGRPATIAADVYSLGCVIWAMLSGRAPYEGTEFQVMDAHVKAPPPYFLDSSPLASSLNTFFARAMAKDPVGRHASVGDAAAELESLLAEAGEVEAGELEPGSPSLSASEAGGADSADDGATRFTPTPGSATNQPSDATAVVKQGPAKDDADHTAYRPAALAATSLPGAATSVGAPAAVGDAPTDPGPRPAGAPVAPSPTKNGSTRRRGVIAAVLAVLLVGVTGSVLAFSLGGDETEGEVAVATDTASADTSSTPPPEVEVTSAPEGEPVRARPRLEASPSYRSIVVREPNSVDGLVLERRSADGEWREVSSESRISTTRGGDRVCAQYRYARSSGGIGEAVRVCGRSAPPTIDLIRTKVPCTSDNQATGCRYYNIEAAGFEPGSEPLVYLFTSGTTLFCPACVPRTMTMDETGRGVHDGPRPTSLGEVQITPSSTYPRLTVEIDGVRRTFELL